MKILDERGHSCPTPLINTMNALKELSIGNKMIVKVDSDTPLENIKRFAESKNFPIEVNKISNNEFDITITKTHELENVEKDSGNCSCGNKNIVVIIQSNVMGQGDEELGKNLMKAFIFALTKQEQLPDIILFYNKGAYLTTDGSESLEDLKKMETQGTKIFTCGTCLEYYKLKEKLVVGEITNMYDIVSMMESAKVIVKP